MNLQYSCMLLLLSSLLPGVVMAQSDNHVVLPEPVSSGASSLEQLLAQRRSVREYQDAALTLAETGQLLWAAQGISDSKGYRTAPSAGALYPLELYVVVGSVESLGDGVYHYNPARHALMKTNHGEVLDALYRVALSQDCIKNAAAVFVFTADYKRTTKKYGERGIRYVHIEVGHAAQNLFLQAESLGLSTVDVGAFKDTKVARVLELPSNLQPLLLMPVGR